MTLDRRAIAVQGIGFGRKLVALQGLFEREEQDTERPNWLRQPPRRKRKKHKDDDVALILALGL
jgi:hypothetical protein